MQLDIQQLSEEKIDEIFKEAKTQDDYVLGLFSAVIPCWSNVIKVHGYPKVSEKTNQYIFRKAMNWDRKYTPKVLASGAWLNFGFGTDQSGTLPDWSVSFEGVEIETNPL